MQQHGRSKFNWNKRNKRIYHLPAERKCDEPFELSLKSGQTSFKPQATTRIRRFRETRNLQQGLGLAFAMNQNNTKGEGFKISCSSSSCFHQSRFHAACIVFNCANFVLSSKFQIDWFDPWLIGLIAFHICITSTALLTRNCGNFQVFLFLVLRKYIEQNK